MTMEVDFLALLVGNAALAALVVDRIYPSTYDQGAASPALRYSKVAGSTGLHMRGSDGLSSDLMQVDARALTALEAMRIRDALVALLHGYSGQLGATAFQLIELNSDRGVQFDETGAEKFYTASLDFDVWSRPA